MFVSFFWLPAYLYILPLYLYYCEPPWEMDILFHVTNIHASKDEAIWDLLALLKDTLTGIRICLFEECI
jgi:hypothetical protein